MNDADDDPVAAHQHELMAAFVKLLKAEDDERQAEAAIKAVKDTYAATLRQSQQAQADAWEDIARLMAETGEIEVILPDENHDYKIAWSTPPEVVDVPDPAAVPDDFCKIERVPKKREILEHLKSLREGGSSMPNWATITRNPGKLNYRLVKKGGE